MRQSQDLLIPIARYLIQSVVCAELRARCVYVEYASINDQRHQLIASSETGCGFCDMQECLESSKEEWNVKLSECTQKYEEHTATLNANHACQTEVCSVTGNSLGPFILILQQNNISPAYSCSGAEARLFYAQ